MPRQEYYQDNTQDGKLKFPSCKRKFSFPFKKRKKGEREIKMLELRDYQKDCFVELEKHFIAKNKKVGLVVIPTGGGKTIVFNSFIHKYFKNSLIVAHRDELLSQSIDKYRLVSDEDEEVNIAILSGKAENGKNLFSSSGKNYTVASIQYLNLRTYELDGKNYDFVVIDEAHHAAADSYKSVIKKLIGTNKNIKILGVTATPFRSDKQDLKEIFGDIVYKIGYKELIAKGYLSPLKTYLVPLNVDLDKLKTCVITDGERDFTNKSISAAFNTPEINKTIVKRWQELACDKKTIFYLSSLEHCDYLKREFEKAGVAAETVKGAMDLNNRRNVLSDFKDGKIQIILNMNVLAEGFDDPAVECVSIVRPTKSLGLYTQIAGRGLRPYFSKTYCLLLDFTGISKRHNVMTAAELFGLDVKRKELRKGVTAGTIRNERGELQMKVLIGDENPEEFVYDGKAVIENAVKIKNDYVLSLGLSSSIILMRPSKNQDKYDIIKIEMFKDPGTKRNKFKKIEYLKKEINEEFAYDLLSAVFERNRDEFMSNYVLEAKKYPVTDRQKQLILKFKEEGYISESDADLKNLNKYTATVVIAYVFALLEAGLLKHRKSAA
jgi:superfamily II DNA or RNA helicase